MANIGRQGSWTLPQPTGGLHHTLALINYYISLQSTLNVIITVEFLLCTNFSVIVVVLLTDTKVLRLFLGCEWIYFNLRSAWFVTSTSGHSFKSSTIEIYDYSVVLARNLPTIWLS